MTRRGSRLAAVLFADVVGYSDLSSTDEASALRLIREFQEACEAEVTRYGGRVVKFLGDGAMAEFGSGRAAVAAAGALHEAFDHPLHIGIHVGDVDTSDGDLLGDGVNVAARLQDLAEADEILVSGAVAFQLRQRTEMEFESRGEQELKGIGPVRVFAVSVVEAIDPGEMYRREEPEREPAEPLWRRLALPVLAPLVLVVAVVLGWWGFGGVGGGASEASIAVLPFRAVGEADPTFAEGIHGDILTRLSSVADLDVISRGSVIRYRDSERPTGEIARDLGVSWILEGEVQEAGEQVRVSARLVEADGQRQVWAEAYRREITVKNIFDIQREITTEIVGALERRLTPREERVLGREPTDDLEAYRYYVQGRELLDRRTEESMRRAITHFERAIERDEEYALAWAGLADAVHLMQAYRYPLPAEAMDPVRAARRAVELDPDLAEAHASLGLALSYRPETPRQEVLRRLERAVELRPSYAMAHNWLSIGHQLHGQPEAALESAQRAVRLDPMNPEALANLTMSYLVNGQMQQALREARRMKELAPEYSTGPFYEALALYHLGEHAEARTIVEGLEVEWTGEGPRTVVALTHAAEGDTAAARGSLARVDPATDPFSHGLVLAALGESGRALERFEEIEAWGIWPTLAIRHLFPETLDPVREMPGFTRVMDRVEGSWGEDP